MILTLLSQPVWAEDIYNCDIQDSITILVFAEMNELDPSKPIWVKQHENPKGKFSFKRGKDGLELRVGKDTVMMKYRKNISPQLYTKDGKYIWSKDYFSATTTDSTRETFEYFDGNVVWMPYGRIHAAHCNKL